jgi:hypothetical protein
MPTKRSRVFSAGSPTRGLLQNRQRALRNVPRARGSETRGHEGRRSDKWWWKSYRGTGDNLREGPYGQLYSRVTARSDTFTVHYRVQSSPATPAAHPNVWNEGSDSIVSDVRGSALLERCVDPDDPRLRDFATDRNATLDDCYKFRVIRTQRFGH